LTGSKHNAGWDAVQISPGDDVAVALRDLTGTARIRRGEEVFELQLREPISLGHKIALADLAAGAEIHKYGAPIGRLTQAAAKGAHIHVHNLVSQRAQKRSGKG